MLCSCLPKGSELGAAAVLELLAGNEEKTSLEAAGAGEEAGEVHSE